MKPPRVVRVQRVGDLWGLRQVTAVDMSGAGTTLPSDLARFLMWRRHGAAMAIGARPTRIASRRVPRRWSMAHTTSASGWGT
jgi:hypothetical protein